jgi:hypothetical protein
MVDGIVRYGNDIGMMMITEPIMRNAIVTAETAVRGYDEAVLNRTRAYAASAEADDAGYTFIRAARYAFALRFGERYTPEWAPTGFPNNSTMIPNTIGGRQSLLRALQNYFANHPEHEQPATGLTSEEAGIRFAALSDARSTVNNSDDLTAAAKKNRDAAIDRLRLKMRGCIEELIQLLPDDDSRWYSYGLNPPAAPDTPETVDGLVLTMAGPGLVLASWNGAPRAARYRVLKQIVGIDGELIAVETVSNTQYAFTGLTAGQTLRVQIQPGNDAGLGNPSETMEIVVA